MQHTFSNIRILTVLSSAEVNGGFGEGHALLDWQINGSGGGTEKLFSVE